MSTRVFISKDESEIEDLIHLFRNKYTFVAHSFLSFTAVDFEVFSSFDVIFFSSPRSIVFYKARYSIPSDILIACVGQKTKQVLEELGQEVSFYRKENQPLKDFAESFKKWCKDKCVLFPISSISLRTVSSYFSERQKVEVVVYSTEIQSKEIEECAVYVFTSPSNVKGFLKQNSFPKNAKIISWGESTSQFILNNGGRVDIELKDSSLKELKSVL